MLRQLGLWLMFIGSLLYGFLDMALAGGVVVGAGAVLFVGHAPSYLIYKTAVLNRLETLGVLRPVEA